jgi:hypothetical protein
MSRPLENNAASLSGIALAPQAYQEEFLMAAPDNLPYEPRFRFEGTELEELLSEWRTLGRGYLEAAEDYIRKNPAQAAAIAFLAGTTLGALLGRRR